MNYKDLKTGEQLTKVLAKDPELFRGDDAVRQMEKYLAGVSVSPYSDRRHLVEQEQFYDDVAAELTKKEPTKRLLAILQEQISYPKKKKKIREELEKLEVSVKGPERHLLSQEDLYTKLAKSLSIDGGVVFVGYRSHYDKDNHEEQISQDQSNLIALIDGINNTNLRSSKSDHPLQIATDLLPATFQEGINKYLRGEITSFDELFAECPTGYGSKMELFRPVLEYAQKQKPISIKITGLANASPKKKLDKMAGEVSPGTIVISYDGFQRNDELLPALVKKKLEDSQVKTYRVSLVPPENLVKAAKLATDGNTEINMIVDLSFLNERPFEYTIIGDLSSVPAPIYEEPTPESTDQIHRTLIIQSQRDQETERALRAERRRATTLDKKLETMSEEKAALEEALTALDPTTVEADKAALKQEYDAKVAELNESLEKQARLLKGRQTRIGNLETQLAEAQEPDDEALQQYGQELVKAANTSLYSTFPQAKNKARFVYHHGEEQLIKLEVVKTKTAQ